MESLLEQLQRFSEVLAVSRTTHVSSWDPATVRRALQWARYMRHVHRRFGRHVRIRTALERRLQNQWQQEDGAGPAAIPGLTNFRDLGHCDLLLSQRLLENRALGDAAFRCLLQQLFPGPGVRDAEEETLRDSLRLQDSLALLSRRRAAVHLLHVHGFGENSALRDDSLVKTQAALLLERLQEAGEADAEGPGRLLGSLGERWPQNSFLEVIAAALLLPSSTPRPPREELELGSPRTPGEGRDELVHWLLGKSDIMATFCRSLPAGLLTSVAGRHPELFQVYLGLLTDWGRHLHYDLQKGIWVGAEAGGVPWEELCGRFRSLCQAPSPLKDEVLSALEACKAQDGDFEVPGVSIWTDLLLAIESGA
ncbi:Fanconi anemia group F protein [Molossus molossus]|uniref:Fanconi anemia group F protein n=1 Tax=Molossus molossus TaxID=27622 RepID=A0A7J8EQ38_MOLMO|nr:Fanconi anemia group F protein [Molossus molossus]KAF6437587.1 FA complementation group F [Molossus molossus]